MKKSKNINFISFIFFDLVLLPLLIHLFLSLPRLYASITYSSFTEQFPSSYVNLNLAFSYLLASLYFILKQTFYKSTKVTLLVILVVVFSVRCFDIETKKIFDFSFSPAFFANVEFESFRIAFEQYWLITIFIISSVIPCLYWIGRLKFKFRYSRKTKITSQII